MFPRIPLLRSLYHRQSLFIKSKAFLKSTVAQYTLLLFPRDESIIDCKMNKLSKVERPLQKPD